jgi:hypothetical protein
MSLLDRLLEIVPDEPGWVDTRGVLLEGPELFGSLDGWVAVRPDRRVLIAAGSPSHEAIDAARAAAEPAFDTLATGSAIPLISEALAMPPTRAFIHEVAPGGLATLTGLPHAELLSPDAPLDHLPTALNREVDEVIGSRPIGVVVEEGLPVSFCYPTLVTERHCDVTIVTLEGYRRGGRAVAAFQRVELELCSTGKVPVWGAAEDNPASLELAAKLGFVPVAEVAIFEQTDWDS